MKITNSSLKFIIFWGVLFLYILGLVSLYPYGVFSHDLQYSLEGNPFYLQWQEYFISHGRLLTHTLARIFFQQGNILYHLAKSFIIFYLFYFYIKSIYVNGNKDWKHKDFLSVFLIMSIFLFINAIFPISTFMMYYGTDTIYLYSYYFSAILMIVLLQYYYNIFHNHTKISIPIFCLLAFLTGSSFEMLIAFIPFIITIYIILKIQKKPIPKWYWLSVPFFLLGFSILLLAPGSSKRVDFYAKATEWDFFGQTINWLDLGWKKYFYTLIKNIFYSSKIWHASPGFLPSSWYIQLLILIFTYLNYRIKKYLWNPTILFPLLWFIFAWYTVVVMSASPLYYWLPVEFSKFFLYISLTSSVYYYIQDKSKKFQIILSSILLSVVIIGQGIQVPAIYEARQEYIQLVSKIESGEITSLTMEELPTARLGNIKIITFGENLPEKYPELFK